MASGEAVDTGEAEEEVEAVSAAPEPVLRRHADHDPALICRPALGASGLCEVLGYEERSDEEGV